eukprot:4525642-Pyramimonas_sp.AAC.1
MFETVLDHLEGVWDSLGVGFYLDSGERLGSVNFVDNLFLVARTFEQFTFMVQSVTDLIWQRYKWTWKPESLEVMSVRSPLAGP